MLRAMLTTIRVQLLAAATSAEAMRSDLAIAASRGAPSASSALGLAMDRTMLTMIGVFLPAGLAGEVE